MLSFSVKSWLSAFGHLHESRGLPRWFSGKEPTYTVGDSRDMGSNPGPARSSGEENGHPLQYSCLENPMDRGDWWVIVHGVAKSQTPLNN